MHEINPDEPYGELGGTVNIPIGMVRIEIDRSRCGEDPMHTFVQDAMGGLKAICQMCHMIDDFVHAYELRELDVAFYRTRFDGASMRWRIDLYDASEHLIERPRRGTR